MLRNELMGTAGSSTSCAHDFAVTVQLGDALQYMILARYTQEVIRDVLANPDAMVERDQHAYAFYGSLGGTVVNAWFTRDLDYHFTVVVDFPSAEAAHAAVLAGWSTGAFEAGKVIPLASQEEFVAALHTAKPAVETFFPPQVPAAEGLEKA